MTTFWAFIICNIAAPDNGQGMMAFAMLWLFGLIAKKGNA